MASDTATNGERLIRIVSQHWIKYVFPIFVYLVLITVSILLFMLAGITAYHYVWLTQALFITALVLFLVAHHWFFLMMLCESSSRIIVTDRRVVWMRDHLFLDEKMMEYAFEKMKTVEARKHGILQTILRFGSLQFESGAPIELVPHPNSVAKDIEQAMGMR